MNKTIKCIRILKKTDSAQGRMKTKHITTVVEQKREIQTLNIKTRLFPERKKLYEPIGLEAISDY
jgi:hypothetical protein